MKRTLMLVVAAAALASACAIAPAPVVTPTIPTVAFDLVACPGGTLTIDTLDQRTLNADGYALLAVPRTLDPVHYRITCPDALGFEDVDATVSLASLLAQPHNVVALVKRPPVIPPWTPLPRLVTRGQFFALDTGERWTRIGLNEHQLLDRWMHDRALYEAVLAQRESILVDGTRAFNTLRIFSMCFRRVDGQLQACPVTFDAAYYVELRAMLDDLNRRRWYVDLVVFGSAPRLMPDPAQRLRHWTAIGEAVQGASNVMVNLGNELDHPANYFDTAPFQRLPGVIVSRGSGMTRSAPPRHEAPWDFELYHTNEAPEWQREAHNAMEFSQGAEQIRASRLPIVVDENKRYPDATFNLEHAHDAAAAIALLTAGGDLHCDHCRYSELWDAREVQAAQAWATGARSVPLACQAGPYSHPITLENRPELPGYDPRWPSYLRVYDRPVAGFDCVVKIRN